MIRYLRCLTSSAFRRVAAVFLGACRDSRDRPTEQR